MDTISTYKSRIDGLMNILFGAGVSNPQTIIEQLNYLLFMRALSVKDDEAELLGIADEAGKIFTGNLAKYKWSNLLALNAEDLFKTLEEAFDAIKKKSENATVKLLFRNAHVKIFDKPTLRRVLHEIEEFSKELDKIAHDGNKDVFGDMYEYLLSKLASAGTNGQFRTPRHIIDFMVRVLDPKKNETILDPACGTAGFLVATYRYIAGEYTSEKLKKAGSPRAMDKLSSEEKNFLYNHMFTGFDSDEDMIKFGMMNLHLHGLTKSRLARQNTLTDTTGYKEKFDVILANPPFSGKLDEESVSEDIRMGTKATELLFLRFMMDHLSSKGKMAVVVPEGVVANSSKAHTKVREMLLENGLWCVVSLPTGVFNPYAGVKTDILFLDSIIADKTRKILFIQVENDGFDLGGQRRPIPTNDLPEITELISQYKTASNNDAVKLISRHLSKKTSAVQLIDVTQINSSPEKSLSIGNYYAQKTTGGEWSAVPLSKVAEFVRGLTYKKDDEINTPSNKVVLRATNVDLTSNTLDLTDPVYLRDDFVLKDQSKKLKKDDILICTASGSKKHLGKVAFSNSSTDYFFGGFMGVIRVKDDILPKYLFYMLVSEKFRNYLDSRIAGININNLNSSVLLDFYVPLPPLEIQKQIVAELDGYQYAIEEANKEAERQKQKIKERIAKIWE